MKLSTIAARIDGELIGDDVEVEGIRSLLTATSSDLTILLENRFREEAKQTKALAIICADRDVVPLHVILVRQPRKILAKLLALFDPFVAQHGIHPSAIVHSSATIGEGVWLDAFVSVGENSEIGSSCQIHAGVRIGRNVSIGSGSIIYPNAVLYDNTIVGSRGILHAGCVLGADGFGFEPDNEGHFIKVTQLARVVLGDDVEVGANTCIDRGAIQDTVIGDGTKFDNLIQVGHNTTIGQHNVFSAACAIGGSTTIGDHNMWGGQTATAGHVRVGNNVTALGRSGITKDVPEGMTIQGFPAQQYKTEWKEQAVLRRWAKAQLKKGEKA